MRLDTVLICTLIGLGLGLRAGHHLWANTPEPELAEPECPEPERASSSAPPRHRVIYRYRDPASTPPDMPHEEPACEQLESDYLWCRAQLERCEHQRDYRREQWPSDAPQEEPGAWSELLERAFEECDIELGLELIDCSEYPCVAALRTGVGAGADTSEQLEQLSERVEAQLQACPVFARELGGGDPEELVALHSYDVLCEDGRREAVLGVTAAPPNSELAARIEGDDWNQLLRWYYRRGEDISASWACD